jgi:hypothetical protein
MPTKRLSTEELWKRGDDWYNNHLRPLVETDENIGKLINIDVESGDYEIGTDRESLNLSRRLIAKNPDAQIIELRIGYPAVSVLPFPRLKLSKSL